jgi:hypothetical protein
VTLSELALYSFVQSIGQTCVNDMVSSEPRSIRLKAPHHWFVHHHRVIVNVELMLVMLLLLVWVRMGLDLVLPRDDRLRLMRGHMVEFRLTCDTLFINLPYLNRMVAHFLIRIAVLFKRGDTIHNFRPSEPGQEVACLYAADMHNGRVEFLQASKKRVLRQDRVRAFGDGGNRKEARCVGAAFRTKRDKQGAAR